MDDLERRLIRCFAAIFSNLSPEKIRTATVESLSCWDSLATMTLVAIVEQEFRTKIDLLDLPELDSFVAIKNYLVKHNSSS